ncbi:hypothetical protein B0H19DRAFT_1196255 [Mycena capillaripes]|nr:hypothetical protein B0H19DRAFT_1199922 [Mycena capillaripes]KAJ6527022.1 hypothetical protein B0H19DRAFT_1196255 [Mycena capillaripes]
MVQSHLSCEQQCSLPKPQPPRPLNQLRTSPRHCIPKPEENLYSTPPTRVRCLLFWFGCLSLGVMVLRRVALAGSE